MKSNINFNRIEFKYGAIQHHSTSSLIELEFEPTSSDDVPQHIIIDYTQWDDLVKMILALHDRGT